MQIPVLVWSPDQARVIITLLENDWGLNNCSGFLKLWKHSFNRTSYFKVSVR